MCMNLHKSVFPIQARCYTIEIPNTVLDVWKAGCILYPGKVGNSISEVDRKIVKTYLPNVERLLECSDQ